jgi:hypothetical protein
MAKNKVKKSGMFLATTQRQFSHHVSPRIPPRSNHQKTTFKPPLFSKPPSETPAKTQKIPRHTSAGFFSNFSKNEAKHPA